MNNKIKAGSRESRLAVIQSEIIIDEIERENHELEVELLTMKTTGDRIVNGSLDKIGGKGLFVKELDRSLREGRVDITIHSLKDIPMEVSEDIPIIGYSKRESPFDVLVLPRDKDKLDFSKPIGCSSKRREIQLKKIYPLADFEPVRGNVLTRLEKLDRGDYSALVLAQAGLKRLSLSDRIFRVFSADEIIPAPGQGIIAVQGRKNEDYSYIENITDGAARFCATVERAFVRALNGGCSAPIGGYCEILENERFVLRGFYSDNINSISDKIEGDLQDAVKIAVDFARKFRGISKN